MRSFLFLLSMTLFGGVLHAAPDTVLYNGRILTVDGDFSTRQALAIDGARIQATGTDAEILALADGETRRIDLAGRTVIPGASAAKAKAITNPEVPLEELRIRLVPLTRNELAALAEVWRDIAKSKTTETLEDQLTAKTAEGNAAETARERLVARLKERNEIFDRYSAVIDDWELKGGDEAAIEEFRTYRLAILADQIKSRRNEF